MHAALSEWWKRGEGQTWESGIREQVERALYYLVDVDVAFGDQIALGKAGLAAGGVSHKDHDLGLRVGRDQWRGRGCKERD